jgi:hypothetical protein
MVQDVGMTEMAPQIRVGDRERRDVDALLQEALGDGVLTLSEYDERAAQCWAARTRTELEAVVRDLPGGRPPQVSASPAGQALATRRVVAVMSESDLQVPLAPGQPVQATAVMGTAKVDLRREDLPPEVHVNAVAVMGEVKVHVPPGSTVHLTGGALMGERKAKLGPPVPGGAVIHVSATAVMGTVVVDDRPRKGGLVPKGSGWAPAPRSGHTGHRTGATEVERAGRHRHVLRRVTRSGLSLALLGGLAFAGAQVVTADDGAAVFSSRTVPVSGGQAEKGEAIEVGVVFGSVEVVVPDDVEVRTTGVTVFGSVDCEQACDGVGDRVVEVRGNGAFGSIEVVTQEEAADRDRD